MVTKVIRIQVQGDDVRVLNEELEDSNEKLEEVEETAGKTGKAFDSLLKFADKFTFGLASKLGGIKTGLTGVAGGFRLVGVAIAASGIGLLVTVIAAITAAFKRSEEGQNKFAKYMGIIGSVVGNVMDVLADIGELIIGLFEGDGEATNAIKSFGKSLWDFVGLPIKNIIDVTESLGRAIGALWNRDIEGALDALNNGVDEVKNNFNEAASAVDRAKNAVNGFSEEIQREARIAEGIASLRAQAAVMDRKLTVERAEADRDIALLREKIANDEMFSIQERLDFVQEASRINEEIVKKEIVQAGLLLEAKKAENNLGKSTIEDKAEEAQLQAELINLTTKQAALQRRLTNERQTLLDEQRAENKPGKQEKGLFLPSFGGTYDDFIIAADAELTAYSDLERAKSNASFYESEARKEYAELEAQARVESYMIAANGFAVASRLIGKETAAGKAFAVASTLVSTYLSAQQAYASQLAIPTPDAPIRAALAAGVAVAAGLANVKEILKVRVPGEGSGGGGVGGSPSRPPAFNVVGNSPENQLNQTLVANQNTPIEAYVVEGNVSSAEQLRRDKIESSSLG